MHWDLRVQVYFSVDAHLQKKKFREKMINDFFVQDCCLLELLVDHVETEAVAGALHLGDQVGDLLLGLDLLLEVLALDEVGQLWVAVGLGGLVQLQEGLVNSLLEDEAGLDGLESAVPLLDIGLGDILEQDPAAPHVLVLDQLLGVLPLLLGVLHEPLGEAEQGDVVALKVGTLLHKEEGKNQ